MTELNPLTKELVETLKELRTRFDNYQHLGPSMVRVDAVLNRYDDLCKQPESPMIKTVSYDNIYNNAERETSRLWAEVLTDFINKIGGDGPSLWQYAEITPTPKKVVDVLQELFDFHNQISADNELDECCDLVKKRYSGCTYSGEDVGREIARWIHDTRRPKPTLKELALKDLETVRKNSDVLPEILDTIEKALQSIPDGTSN